MKRESASNDRGAGISSSISKEPTISSSSSEYPLPVKMSGVLGVGGGAKLRSFSKLFVVGVKGSLEGNFDWPKRELLTSASGVEGRDAMELDKFANLSSKAHKHTNSYFENLFFSSKDYVIAQIILEPSILDTNY
jgi:hypothetical protein